MLKIGIIVGSTRPNRASESVANWVYKLASKRTDAEFEVVDLKEYNLPLFDEPMSPALGNYTNAHTKEWAAKIATFDSFIFVTPEYNHSISGALKNAIDFIYAEWNNKSAGIVSYGAAGGVRAAEALRLILGEVQIADVRAQVYLSLFTDFENWSIFKPAPNHEKSLNAMIDQVVAWGEALKGVRENVVTVN